MLVHAKELLFNFSILHSLVILVDWLIGRPIRRLRWWIKRAVIHGFIFKLLLPLLVYSVSLNRTLSIGTLGRKADTNSSKMR